MKATDLEIKIAAISLQKAGRLTGPNLRAMIRGGSSERVRRIIREVRESAATSVEPPAAIQATTTLSLTDGPATCTPEAAGDRRPAVLQMTSITSSTRSAPDFFSGRHCGVARAALSLSQPELARLLEVGRATLARFEAGEKVSPRIRDALYAFFTSRDLRLMKRSVGWKA